MLGTHGSTGSYGSTGSTGPLRKGRALRHRAELAPPAADLVQPRADRHERENL
jgi:hypothetical protein